MRFIEENLGPDVTVEAAFNRDRLDQLQDLVSQLTELYQDLGLKPHLALRSALADFAGDFPGEIAVLYRVRGEA